jgi:hypothetical protein
VKYQQLYDGDWVTPVLNGYRIACCDCGLVHVLQFKVVKGAVKFRAWRHDRATAAVRRKRKG